MSSPISTSISTTDRSANGAALFALSRRYSTSAQFQVALSPLLPASEPGGSAVGYLARPDSSPEEPASPEATDRELAILTWTTMAVDALHPNEFIAVTVTPELALVPAFGRTVRQLTCDRLMLVFETARVGRRRQTLVDAVSQARRCGVRVGVSGARVASAEGFDALVVTPSTTALAPPAGGAALIIAAELRTEDDLEWALSYGADLLEGPVLGAPMTVAPVDLSRLRRLNSA
jgi:hypothetical protein